MLAQLKADFPDDLQVVYRHYPLLNLHDKAALATQAAEAAGLQGQFWAMHDVLFERQDEWVDLSADKFGGWLGDRATKMGLDADQFFADLTSDVNVNLAQKAWDDGVEASIPGTPFLLINGRIYDGPTDYFNLSAIIKLFALQERQYIACPPLVIDPFKQYIATLETKKGDIVIQLLAEDAPLAVNNFVFLANEGWYEGVTFHRVQPGFMAQAGDPSGTGFGGPGYTFRNESSDLRFDSEGIVAMANAGPDSNGSQFFITYSPTPHLDREFTIFGRVLEGMDVATRLTPRDLSQNANAPPGDTIITVTIEER